MAKPSAVDRYWIGLARDPETSALASEPRDHAGTMRAIERERNEKIGTRSINAMFHIQRRAATQ